MMKENVIKILGLRNKLIRDLKDKGIKDPLVLEAIKKVPRHLFVDKYSIEMAYDDRALNIDAEQTISQPYTVAYQSELLNLSKGYTVLEIGTGSGYQTAILLELGADVYTIERQEVLYNKAKALLNSMGYYPKCFLGDGTLGVDGLCFDRIIITAAAPKLPKQLMKQLKIGGLLVAPIGSMHKQCMTVIIRKTEKDFDIIKLDKFKFVPLIGVDGWNT